MAKLPEYNAIEIGQRLRQVRGELGYTQAELAAVLGISLSHVSKLEIGIGRMSRLLLMDILEKTGINKNWILEGHGLPWPSGERPEDKMKTDTDETLDDQYPGNVLDRLPDEALMEQIVEAVQNPKNRELAETTAAQLKISETKALALLIRANLQQ